MSGNTCASCRWFGRDEKPMLDDCFDGKKRYPCNYYRQFPHVDLILYVTADRPACPYFNEVANETNR